jgi:hypothetical protein
VTAPKPRSRIRPDNRVAIQCRIVYKGWNLSPRYDTCFTSGSPGIPVVADVETEADRCQEERNGTTPVSMNIGEPPMSPTRICIGTCTNGR